MQNKHQNPTPGNMTGIYLGMKGSPPRFNHIAAIPPLFRRLSLCRPKTSVEYQRFKKIEMLRVIEPMQGFKGAAVKAKIKSVSPEVELHHQHHNRSTVLTAEELSKLARKVLKDFGIPRESNNINLSRGNISSRLLSSQGKLSSSSHQPSIQEISVITNSGRSIGHCRPTLPKHELTRIKPRQKEICESVKPFQSVRMCPIRQLRSSKAQHLALNRCLQSSQVFTRTEQGSRTAKTCSQNATKDKMLLPSSYVSGTPLLLPRMSTSLGRVHLAGQWGYKMPRLNTALGNDLISKTLELKQRTDGNDTNKLVTMAAQVNGNRVTNGLERLDGTKSKSSDSVKVCSVLYSGARTSPHSVRNGHYTDRSKDEQVDSYKYSIPESSEEDHSEHLDVEGSDLTKLEDSEMPNTDDEKEDEESLAMDSTVQLAKQIEVIINLKTKVEETIEKDLQMNSDEVLD